MAETKVTNNEINNKDTMGFLFADQTTTSTAFTDLANVGPAVTVDIGVSGKALVFISCGMYNGSDKFAGYSLSGANTVSADTNVDNAARSNVTNVIVAGNFAIHTGLAPGSTTFTMKYRTSAGTANFFNRRIVVIPL